MPRLYQINMLKLSKILLIIFACSTAISLLSVYYTHQLPTCKTEKTTLYVYQHNGIYDYTAVLKPNLIYNKTTLTPKDNATLYTAIVEYINLTFTYAFKSNPEPENVTINHQITIQIESPGRWSPRTLQPAEVEEMFQLSGNLNWTMQINGTKVRQFVEAIDKEIYGTTRSTTYNIKIKPEIHVTANIAMQTIDENFTPEITVAFKSETEKGNYITIENINQAKHGGKTQTYQTPLPHVQTERAASLTATAITASILTISAFLYIKHKPPIPQSVKIEKHIKRLTDPYKELIAKTKQKPPETKTTIEMETLEDLAKIAEILAKPILHTTTGKEHIFYIIDHNTKYQYKKSFE